jgi:hypothetical protein
MRKEIVLVLVAAVLILGGVAAVFESVDVTLWKVPTLDLSGPKCGGLILPSGDPLPDGPS